MSRRIHELIGNAHSTPTIGDIGYEFRKRFHVGWFTGRVVEIRPGAANGRDRRCIYDDGDMEDLSIYELKELARKDPKNKSKSRRQPSRPRSPPMSCLSDSDMECVDIPSAPTADAADKNNDMHHSSIPDAAETKESSPPHQTPTDAITPTRRIRERKPVRRLDEVWIAEQQMSLWKQQQENKRAASSKPAPTQSKSKTRSGVEKRKARGNNCKTIAKTPRRKSTPTSLSYSGANNAPPIQAKEVNEIQNIVSGVWKHKDGKWQANHWISDEKKRMYLGLHDTYDEAVSATKLFKEASSRKKAAWSRIESKRSGCSPPDDASITKRSDPKSINHKTKHQSLCKSIVPCAKDAKNSTQNNQTMEIQSTTQKAMLHSTKEAASKSVAAIPEGHALAKRTYRKRKLNASDKRLDAENNHGGNTSTKKSRRRVEEEEGSKKIIYYRQQSKQFEVRKCMGGGKVVCIGLCDSYDEARALLKMPESGPADKDVLPDGESFDDVPDKNHDDDESILSSAISSVENESAAGHIQERIHADGSHGDAETGQPENLDRTTQHATKARQSRKHIGKVLNDVHDQRDCKMHVDLSPNLALAVSQARAEAKGTKINKKWRQDNMNLVSSKSCTFQSKSTPFSTGANAECAASNVDRSSSKTAGIHFETNHGKWVVRPWLPEKKIKKYLGLYDTYEEALDVLISYYRETLATDKPLSEMMATVHSEELPPSSLVAPLPDSDSLSKTDDQFASQKIARTTEESVATSPSKSIPLSDEASVASAQSKVVGDLMSRSPDITSRKERGGLKFEVTSGICEGKKNKHDSPYKAAYDGVVSALNLCEDTLVAEKLSLEKKIAALKDESPGFKCDKQEAVTSWPNSTSLFFETCSASSQPHVCDTPAQKSDNTSRSESTLEIKSPLTAEMKCKYLGLYNTYDEAAAALSSYENTLFEEKRALEKKISDMEEEFKASDPLTATVATRNGNQFTYQRISSATTDVSAATQPKSTFSSIEAKAFFGAHTESKDDPTKDRTV